MGRFSYSAGDEWGIIYLFKKGYNIVTSNIDEWVARYWYVDKKGNIYQDYKKGRKLKIELNPAINFTSDDYILPMREEIENMDQRKGELEKVLSMIEKKVHRGLNLGKE